MNNAKSIIFINANRGFSRKSQTRAIRLYDLRKSGKATHITTRVSICSREYILSFTLVVLLLAPPPSIYA